MSTEIREVLTATNNVNIGDLPSALTAARGRVAGLPQVSCVEMVYHKGRGPMDRSDLYGWLAYLRHGCRYSVISSRSTALVAVAGQRVPRAAGARRGGVAALPGTRMPKCRRVQVGGSAGMIPDALTWVDAIQVRA